MQKQLSAASKRNIVIIAILICTGVLMLFGLWHDTALAVPQNTTLDAAKDKFVDATGGYDNWTVGDRTYLYVGYQGDLDFKVEQSVFCFNVSGIPGPVTSAVLRLYSWVATGGTEINVYGSNNDGWSETDATVPSKDLTLLTNQPTSVNSDESTFEAYDFDVTSFIETQRSGDDVATLVLSPVDTVNTNEIIFVSSEDSRAGYRPQLAVTYIEPSTSISASPALTESNINGAAVTVTLDGMTFADASLNTANFTVNGAPFTVSGVSYTDEIHCTLTLGYGGGDFDINKSFSVAIAGAELSVGSNITTANTLSVTADNDAEILSISSDGSITEGSENGEVITATITGGQFADTITPANWTVSNLPEGVTKGTVTRVNDTAVRITLSGNSTIDYDSNITNVSVSCTSAEYTDSTGGGSLSDTGVTFTAANDAESISISGDGSITEGSENGEVITATITGGQFADTITPANWTVSNLPEGVTKGTVTRVNDTAVRITLSGNSTIDYDSNITNVSVSCTSAEYTDSTGGGSLSDTGVTFTAVNDAESISISGDGLITEGSENGEVITATITGGQFADTITPANWTISNLPEGVTKGTVTRVNGTAVRITLLENSTADYDSDITNVSVSCTSAEYTDSTGGGSLSDTGVTFTAVNDAESISISGDGSITEGSENGEVITATITGGQFADTITPANWTISNLPEGVTKGTVTRVNDTVVRITLSGNALWDYDSDITNVSVACTANEYTDNTGGGSLNGTGVTFTAVNDAEVLSISDDGSITEGSESGEVITATITGGQFAETITSWNWTISKLPAGVYKGGVTRIDAHTVEITLFGNATADYDIDITNVSVTCNAGQYVSGTQPLTASTGVVLEAIVEEEPASSPTPEATQTPAATPLSSATPAPSEPSSPLPTLTTGPSQPASIVIIPESVEEDEQAGTYTVEINVEDLPEGTKFVQLSSGDVIDVAGQTSIKIEIGKDELNEDGTIEIIALGDENVPLSACRVKVSGGIGIIPVSADEAGGILAAVLWIALGIAAAAVAAAAVVIILKKRKAGRVDF